jgi:hypothetical protein
MRARFGLMFRNRGGVAFIAIALCGKPEHEGGDDNEQDLFFFSR